MHYALLTHVTDGSGHTLCCTLVGMIWFMQLINLGMFPGIEKLTSSMLCFHFKDTIQHVLPFLSILIMCLSFNDAMR